MRMPPLAAAVLMAVALAAPAPALAQSEPGHVYQINEFRAYPGMESAYSQSYHEYLRPIWNEIVRRGGMVRYIDLWKQAGDLTEGTHLIVLDFESWEDYSGFGQAADAASRATTGRPWAVISEEEFVPLRELLRNQVFAAPPGGA
jgi:hypothetical protein